MREDFVPTKSTGKPDYTEQRGQLEVIKDVNAYNSEIFYTDHWVGKLLERVDALGLRDNTLVVLAADHGESVGESAGIRATAVGCGSRSSTWPLIFRLPGRIEAGRVVETKVSTIDIMPTDPRLDREGASAGRADPNRVRRPQLGQELD